MPSGSPADVLLVDGFAREELLRGPSPWVFTLEDQLEIDSICSAAGVTLTVSGVMLSGDFQLKPFRFAHAPNSNRTLASTRQAIGSGWLLRVRVSATAGAPMVGQCFAWLRTCRGLTSVAEVNGTIAGGYVTANADVFWPGPAIGDPLGGAGAIRSITGAVPAAGAEVSETVPTGARWRLLAFRAQLVSSATVASRVASLEHDDGVNVSYVNMQTHAVQSASSAWIYFWARGGADHAFVSIARDQLRVPDLWLAAGHRIRTSTANLQVDDQWSSIQYLVQEWLEVN